MVEALSDTRISFTLQEWDSLIMTGLDNDTAEGSMMYCLGRLPPLMQRVREFVSRQSSPASLSRTALLLEQEFRSLYNSYQPILSKFRTRWNTIDETLISDTLTPLQKRFAHCQHSRMLAFALAISLVIDCSLVTLNITNTAIAQEIVQIVEEILELADVVKAYRPLANISTMLGLVAALGAISVTRDVMSAEYAARLTAEIEARLEDDMTNLYGERVELTDEDRDKCRAQFALRPFGMPT